MIYQACVPVLGQVLWITRQTCAAVLVRLHCLIGSVFVFVLVQCLTMPAFALVLVQGLTKHAFVLVLVQ